MSKPIDFRPVILAGGSGTRFWPRSRRARAKQVLALDGERSMIQQTLERLKPLAGLDKTWIITNEYLAQEIADQLPGLPAKQIVQEPVARNTAPAFGLGAFLFWRGETDWGRGGFSSDLDRRPTAGPARETNCAGARGPQYRAGLRTGRFPD